MPKRFKPTQKRKIWGQRELKKDDEILKDGRENDIIIPVMGPTGVGKSTFINNAVGHSVMSVGHGLRSHTAKIQHTIIPHPTDSHRRVILVDTPGFDDTFTDDAEILRRIAVWLAQSYSDKMKLSGIIYLHEISQTRMLGTTRKNFNMFNKLCGTVAMRGVILATTKWGDIKVEVGTQREEQLANDSEFWKPMIELGSGMCRFMGSFESAWDIISMILANADSKDAVDAVQIQVELVELGKMLGETEAGRTLRYTLEEYSSLQKNLAEQARKQAATGRAEELQRRLDESEKKLQSVLQQIKTLDVPLSRRIKSFFGF